MRLLNSYTLELEEYHGTDVPDYAILSHRWEEEEFTFEDLKTPTTEVKKGYRKIKSACSLTRHYGLDYLWVDTCCIDKASSSELAEAINSMYRWYTEAAVCFAYLSDVQLPAHPIRDSVWFSRGWTLQELIAPRRVRFHDKDWHFLGTKKDLIDTLVDATGIDLNVLIGRKAPFSCSVAQRMSWAARRTTERVEDRAYSLLGLFDVHMTLLYGEGDRAFVRLQEEIIRYSDDQSIFAWDRGFRAFDNGRCGLLATSLSQFSECRSVVSSKSRLSEERTFSVTNIGLSISMTTIPWTMETFLAILDCSLADHPEKNRLGIFVERLSIRSSDQQYARVQVKGVSLMVISDKRWSSSRLFRHSQTRQLHFRRATIYPSPNMWYGFYLETLTLPGVSEKQLSEVKVYTRGRSGMVSRERSSFLAIPNGKCGTVAVWRLPHSTGDRSNISWMQFGFDDDFVPWCRFGRRGSTYDYASPSEYFDDERMLTEHDNHKTSWHKEGYVLLEGDRRRGLDEEVGFLDTRISIKRRRISSLATYEKRVRSSERVWTIDVEALEVSNELRLKRRRRRVSDALKDSAPWAAVLCPLCLARYAIPDS
jgi:hypothetical protein